MHDLWGKAPESITRMGVFHHTTMRQEEEHSKLSKKEKNVNENRNQRGGRQSFLSAQNTGLPP